jgi:CRISPR-associated protein Cas5d
MPQTLVIEVSGDFACFTRPEMKVERVSYDVMTPSAARAIFEAIFWKPAIKWQVSKIEVLNPIQWASVRRNEVGAVVPSGSVKQAMNSGKGTLGICIEDDRQQRASLLLRDVRYRIFAELLFDQSKDQESEYGKYLAMFERRVGKGQCFNQPYLGCREFSCSFRPIYDLATESSPISESRSLGWMLYDMDYTNGKTPHPKFFNANLHMGVINVPTWDAEGVRG